jgi:hypothetical protein
MALHTASCEVGKGKRIVEKLEQYGQRMEEFFRREMRAGEEQSDPDEQTLQEKRTLLGLEKKFPLWFNLCWLCGKTNYTELSFHSVGIQPGVGTTFTTAYPPPPPGTSYSTNFRS